MNPVRILAVSGSLRARSLNTELLVAAAQIAPGQFAVAPFTELADLPHFNPDLDKQGSRPPAAVARLKTQLAESDALLISSPEYAHGVPGALKNALDWLVSGEEMPGKPVGLLTASGVSQHAPAALVEILRTMSASVVPGAVRVVPLGGRPLDASAILSMPALVGEIRLALEALADAVMARRAE